MYNKKKYHKLWYTFQKQTVYLLSSLENAYKIIWKLNNVNREFIVHMYNVPITEPWITNNVVQHLK